MPIATNMTWQFNLRMGFSNQVWGNKYRLVRVELGLKQPTCLATEMSTSTVCDTVPIRCKRCNHSWQYKGKNIYVVTCPHCGTKIGIRLNVYSSATLCNYTFPILLTQIKKEVALKLLSPVAQLRS
jgi:DNA-directed RNA polymerase subunit RPC12/RpoP